MDSCALIIGGLQVVLKVRHFPPLPPAFPGRRKHLPFGDDGDVGELHVALLLGVLAVHHIESIELQQNHQRVLAGEEHVHVADDFKVGDEQQAEDQKRGVLEGDVEGDAPHIDGATALRP